MQRAEILKHLQMIQDAEGRITPKAVVDRARPPDSPLHPLFEWDDSIAGDLHRQNQARTLIRTVKVDLQVNHTIIRSVAYLRDPEMPPKVQGYRAVQALRSDIGNAGEAVLYEFRRAESNLRRARDAAYALGFAPLIEGLIDDMRRIALAVRHDDDDNLTLVPEETGR